MSLALIKSFGRKIKVEKYGAGAYVDGFWVPGNTSLIEITASCQPMTANELLRLPENQRTKEWVKIFTTTKLSTADTEKKTNADVLIIDGSRYEVSSVKNYTMQGPVTGIQYYRCDAVRENRKVGT